MKSFQVKIKSLSPYMQHRMDDLKLDQWEKLRGKIMERSDISHVRSGRVQRSNAK